MEAVRGHQAVDFVTGQAVPLLVLGQVAQDPGSVDAAIDKASKQGSDNELVTYAVSNLDFFLSGPASWWPAAE